jgi:hypothetical protein
MTNPYDALRERFINDRASAADEEFRDKGLVENVLEARSNGYDTVCTDCGVGITDESDMHERWCPQFVDTDRR